MLYMQTMNDMQALADLADKIFDLRPWTSRELFEAVPDGQMPASVQYAIAQGGTRSPVMSLGRMLRASDLFMPCGRVRTGEHLWRTTAAVNRKWPSVKR